MKIYWLTGSDNFNVAADWSGDHVPDSTDIAAMTVPGTYTVTANTNSTVLGLTTGANTTFAVAGGTIFTATEGTATGADRGQVVLANGSEFNIGGTFDNIGSIAINGSSGTTFLIFLNYAVLDGGGTINMLSSPNSKINVENTLINVNNTIEGAGSIEGGGLLVNETNGEIDANSPGGILVVVTPVQNSGLMVAADTGILNIFGTVTNTATGAIDASANSTVNLGNADILGGTLEAAGGVIDDIASPVLDGSGSHPVTLKGTLDVEDASTLAIAGVLNNMGTISVDGTTDTTDLLIGASGDAEATLEGGGNITLSTGLNYIEANTGLTSVTLNNVNNVISGSGIIQGNVTLNNEKLGVVDATSIYELSIDSVVDNAGLLEATGGGDLLLLSNINNTATGIIEAGIGSGAGFFPGVSVTGGTLKTVGTGIINAGGAKLNSVTNTGSLVFDYSGLGSQLVSSTNTGQINIDDDANLAIHGVIDNVGTIGVDATTDPTYLYIGASGDPEATLEGGGAVVLSAASLLNNIEPNTGLTSATLNNVNNVISGSGVIADLTLNNEKLGVVDATAGNVLDVYGVVDNAGLLEATGTGGSLQLFSVINNTTTGIIEASTGSDVVIEGTVTGGTLKTLGTGFIYSGGADLNSVTNVGTLIVDDTNLLKLGGTINNTGGISLDSTGDPTQLLLEGSAVTLKGNGNITLSNSSENSISGASPGGLTQLNNDGNAISGAGLISNLILDNAKGGLIDANDTPPLIIDTGLNTVVNAGTLQAEFGHELYIGSAVNNTGLLNANGGTIAIAGSVSGTGTASDTGEIEFGAAASTSTKFFSGVAAELILDDSVKYTGTISGFGAAQSIDLADINEATATLSFSSGVLTVNDHEGDIAKIKFSGPYVLGDFHIANDGGGGTLLTDPPVDTAPQTIADGATLEIDNGATGTITFAGPTGTLQLDSSWSFSGKVAGFGGQDQIDLADIAFDTQTTLGYAKTGAASGKLTVSDGIHTANIALLGNYMGSSFATASDGHGGTMITEVAQTYQQPLLTHPHV